MFNNERRVINAIVRYITNTRNSFFSKTNKKLKINDMIKKNRKNMIIGRKLLNNLIFFFFINDDNKKLLNSINIKKNELVEKFKIKFVLYEMSYI